MTTTNEQRRPIHATSDVSTPFVFIPFVSLAGSVTAHQVESEVVCSEGSEPLSIAYGDHTSGCTINPSTDLDTFAFSGSAGERIRVLAQNGGGPFDLQVELRESDGDLVGTMACDGGCCAGVLCSVSNDFLLGESGEFQITVSDQGMDETGSYALQIERFPPLTPAPALTRGESEPGALQHRIDVDQFSFMGTLGETVRITGPHRALTYVQRRWKGRF